ARSLDADDDALAELLVAHVVTDLEPELVGAARRRWTRFERGVDRPFAVLGAVVRARTPVVVRPHPARRPPVALDLFDQRLGDLVEEPARRVVLRTPEQRARPRVGEMQLLHGTSDAHVAEAALLLE